jgi:hypothetical protein
MNKENTPYEKRLEEVSKFLENLLSPYGYNRVFIDNRESTKDYIPIFCNPETIKIVPMFQDLLAIAYNDHLIGLKEKFEEYHAKGYSIGKILEEPTDQLTYHSSSDKVYSNYFVPINFYKKRSDCVDDLTKR